MTKGKQIPIRCKGSRCIPYDQLKTFQGDLKGLTEDRATELKEKIIELGWVSPVFVWNQNEILDGHQRLKVLHDLLKEGYTIGDIPVVDIEAGSKKEAAKILLVLESRYGHTLDEGLYEFMNNMDLTIADLGGLELPDIDFGVFKKAFFDIDAALPDLPDGDKPPFQQMTFILHDSQVEAVTKAMKIAKGLGAFTDTENENSNGNALARVCETFITQNAKS